MTISLEYVKKVILSTWCLVTVEKKHSHLKNVTEHQFTNQMRKGYKWWILCKAIIKNSIIQWLIPRRQDDLPTELIVHQNKDFN